MKKAAIRARVLSVSSVDQSLVRYPPIGALVSESVNCKCAVSPVINKSCWLVRNNIAPTSLKTNYQLQKLRHMPLVFFHHDDAARPQFTTSHRPNIIAL